MSASVAICGRANVGKSTLFNALCARDKALVHNRPGVTRDWIASMVVGSDVELIDTAGMELAANDALGAKAWLHSIEQISHAQLVLFVVDGRAGLLPDDELLARQLRKSLGAQRIMLLVNKAENLSVAEAMAEFQPLGFANWQLVSAAHGVGLGELRAMLRKLGSERTGRQAEAAALQIALIGRPNVGKSTLANRILGSSRMLVSEQPGTTIDSVDTHFEYKQSALVLIDTAGVRRKAKTERGLEQQSGRRARNQAQRADIVLFMASASEGVVHQDQQLARLVCGFGKTALVLLNKADLVAPEERRLVIRQAKRALPYMEYARFMLISAQSEDFAPKQVLDPAIKSHALASQRSSPQQITKILQQAVQEHEPPRSHGKRPRLRFAHQAGTNPILIVVHGRHVKLIKEPYLRYLTGRFSAELGYGSAPFQIRLKESSGSSHKLAA